MTETKGGKQKSKTVAEKLLPWAKAKRFVDKLIEHWSYIVFTLLLTFYVLFVNDIRQLIPNKEVDAPFFISILAVFGFFFLELIAMCLFKEGYFIHFFFWVDLLSTLTILLDVDWISDAIFPTGSSKTVSYAAIARAARASRVGSRIGRIIRIVRLIRLLRIIKVYKISEQKKLKDEMGRSSKRRSESGQNPPSKSAFNARPLGKVATTLKNATKFFSRKRKDEDRETLDALAGNGTMRQYERSAEPMSYAARVMGAQVRNLPQRTIQLSPKPLPPLDVSTIKANSEASEQKSSSSSDENSRDEKKTVALPAPRKSVPRLSLPPAKPRASLSARTLLNAQPDSNSSFQHPRPSVARKSIFRPSGVFRQRNSLNDDLYITDEAQVFESLDFNTAFNDNEEMNVENFNQHIFEETNVGRKLSDSTTKRIVVIVLLLMISIPLFSLETYISPYSKYQFGIDEMQATLQSQPQLNPAFNSMWDYYVDMLEIDNISIIYMKLYWVDGVGGSSLVKGYYNSTDVSSFRDSEIQTFYSPEDETPNEFFFEVSLDYRYNQRIISILSIVRTIFLCVVFAGAALLFTHEATNLVLEPIENMMMKIKNITENPLNAAIMEEEEAYFMEKVQKDSKARKKAKMRANNETNVLVKIITKIGALLAVGFGEAGSEIIVQNMESGGALNPMIPGRKVLAVFGFCDIRNFTDATEVLQENVMMFVNDIAEIVHSKTDFYGGKANKNIGDAFLLVWKVDGNFEAEEDPASKEAVEHRAEVENRRNVCCELAVLSFVQILIDLNRNASLNPYNNHPGLKARIKNFKIRMGLGLHLGWAIECAIGSEYKIDASYLSPHVNMSSRLEAATKMFGVPILISDSVAENLSPGVAAYLRRIDVVQPKGTEQPMTLYTFDGEFDRVKVVNAPSAPQRSGMEKKSQKYMDRMSKNVFLNSVFQRKASVLTLFEKNPHIQLVRTRYTADFYERWNGGFEHYLRGDWPAALSAFVDCLNLVESDGPSKNLIEVINSFDGRAPPGWTGVRPFVEK